MKTHAVIVEELPGVLVTHDWSGAPVKPYMGDSYIRGVCIETGAVGNPACGEPRCEVTHERLKQAARAVSLHCQGAAHRLARSLPDAPERP
jgi:hypothetical protein